jgi:hypothetical protein
MKCPGEVHTSSPRPYRSLPGLSYPFHARTITVTNCGRIGIGRKKINLSRAFSGQDVGIKEVGDGVWLVSFMDYDLGYFDEETKKTGTFRVPVCTGNSVTYVSGTNCYPCVRYGPALNGSSGRTRTCDPAINSRLLYQLSYRGMNNNQEFTKGVAQNQTVDLSRESFAYTAIHGHNTSRCFRRLFRRQKQNCASHFFWAYFCLQ